jgi:molecular chaperone HtpG
MTEYKSKAGKKLLKMLMFSTYSDARMIYREYIQNACDSINEAIKLNILSQKKDGHININIDYYNNRVTIKDNGTGIKAGIAESTLIDIANSKKDGYTTAGYFGIGRFMGAGFCDKISFRTSYKGETAGTEIVFDNQLANCIIADDEDDRSATDVIDAITTTTQYEEQADEHYFIVTLQGINASYPVLLDENEISAYLQQVVPIDYKMPFRNNLIRTNIPNDYTDLFSDLDIYQVSLNDIIDIRKTYHQAVVVKSGEDDIKNLHFFKLENDDFGLLAWGWYGVSELSGELKEEDINRGIRLRIHNIMIGNANRLNEHFKSTRGNNYFIGEIHVVHRNIIPNTDRSDLAPSPEAAQLKNTFTDYFAYLTQLYNVANDVKNAIKKVNEKEEQLQQAIAEENDLDIELFQKELSEAKSNLIKKTDVSRKGEPEVAKQIIDIIKEKYNVPEPTLQPREPEEPDEELPPPPKSKPTDIYEPLKTNFSSDKIDLIKRVFNSFSDNCPMKDKKLIEQLKRQVIKDLGR